MSCRSKVYPPIGEMTMAHILWTEDGRRVAVALVRGKDSGEREIHRNRGKGRTQGPETCADLVGPGRPSCRCRCAGQASSPRVTCKQEDLC